MARLVNHDTMTILTKKSLDSTLSSKVGTINQNKVEYVVIKDCEQLNLKLTKNFILKIGNVSMKIPYFIKDEYEMPKAMVLCNFSITTGSGQTTFKNNLKRLKEFRYSNHKYRDMFIIAVIDGAGWVARQSDTLDIHDYADFCLNLAHIKDIKNILEESI